LIPSDTSDRANAAQERYWCIVHDCLTALHRWSPAAADDAIARLRERLAVHEDPDFPVMIYHAEPFEVACDLADQQVDYAAHREAYEAILDRARSSIGGVAPRPRSSPLVKHPE
jgi:hypothetical protein